MGPTQRSQRRRMIGFRFGRHPGLNLPEEYLNLFGQILEEQVRKIKANILYAKAQEESPVLFCVEAAGQLCGSCHV